MASKKKHAANGRNAENSDRTQKRIRQGENVAEATVAVRLTGAQVNSFDESEPDFLAFHAELRAKRWSQPMRSRSILSSASPCAHGGYGGCITSRRS